MAGPNGSSPNFKLRRSCFIRRGSNETDLSERLRGDKVTLAPQNTCGLWNAPRGDRLIAGLRPFRDVRVVAKHGPAAFTSSAVRAVRFIRPGKDFMDRGNFVRSSAIAIGLIAVVVAAIYWATRLLLLLQAGMAP